VCDSDSLNLNNNTNVSIMSLSADIITSKHDYSRCILYNCLNSDIIIKLVLVAIMNKLV